MLSAYDKELAMALALSAEMASAPAASSSSSSSSTSWNGRKIESLFSFEVAKLAMASLLKDMPDRQVLPVLVPLITDYAIEVPVHEKLIIHAQADENVGNYVGIGVKVIGLKDQTLTGILKVANNPEFQKNPVSFVTNWNNRREAMPAGINQGSLSPAGPDFDFGGDMPRVYITRFLQQEGMMPKEKPTSASSSSSPILQISFVGNDIGSIQYL